MITIAFFYLLCPGEYTASASDTQAFDYQSVQLFFGPTCLDLVLTMDAQLCCTTSASLTFDNQKNGVHGEVISLGFSGNPSLCSVKAIMQRAIHLCQNCSSPHTPLSLNYCATSIYWKPVTPSQVFAILKDTVTFLGPALGFLTVDVSACCLHTARANVLLNACIDPEVSTLTG